MPTARNEAHGTGKCWGLFLTVSIGQIINQLQGLTFMVALRYQGFSPCINGGWVILSKRDVGFHTNGVSLRTEVGPSGVNSL